MDRIWRCGLDGGREMRMRSRIRLRGATGMGGGGNRVKMGVELGEDGSEGAEGDETHPHTHERRRRHPMPAEAAPSPQPQKIPSPQCPLLNSSCGIRSIGRPASRVRVDSGCMLSSGGAGPDSASTGTHKPSPPTRPTQQTEIPPPLRRPLGMLDQKLQPLLTGIGTQSRASCPLRSKSK